MPTALSQTRCDAGHVLNETTAYYLAGHPDVLCKTCQPDRKAPMDSLTIRQRAVLLWMRDGGMCHTPFRSPVVRLLTPNPGNVATVHDTIGAQTFRTLEDRGWVKRSRAKQGTDWSLTTKGKKVAHAITG